MNKPKTVTISADVAKALALGNLSSKSFLSNQC